MLMKPLVIDLCCGLGGWTHGFLAEGWDAVGFDIERHVYGQKRYPAQLVLQDILTLDGRQFRGVASCIVASPPCQAYSYMAMPWTRAKREISWQRWAEGSPFGDFRLNDLFNACFRIASEAELPIVVENVKGAQAWVGRAKWHHGSYYLWGDVPALMPHTLHTVKVQGFNFHQHEKGGAGGSFQSAAVAGMKTVGHVNKRDGFDHTRNLTNQRESEAVKQHGSGAAWFDKALDERRKGGARKAASAMIAEIPFDLASWIARCFKPDGVRKGLVSESGTPVQSARFGQS